MFDFLIAFTVWDMSCMLIKRILSLFANNIISTLFCAFYAAEFLARFASDIWHVSSHVCPLCVIGSPNCVVNPKLQKFNNILRHNDKNINMLTVEQLWPNWNKLKFIHAMNKSHIIFLLFLFREHHNKKVKKHIEAMGYTFIDITSFKPIRTLQNQSQMTNKTVTLTDVKHASQNIAGSSFLSNIHAIRNIFAYFCVL